MKYKVGFQDLNEEVSIENLEVLGEIPEWLSGTLLRMGPAKFETRNQKLNHWFDGFAMLHNFTFQNGKVSYKNKFLKSDTYELAQKNGKINYREFATDPCRSIFKKFFTLFSGDLTDNNNVNITRIFDEYVALTETTLPISFDPKLLETKNHFKFEDDLKGQITPAHPHFDFQTKEGFNYLINLSYKNHYLIYKFTYNSKERKLIAKIPVQNPSYMHSFALTKNYVILVEWPLVVNPFDLAFSNDPFIKNYKWEAEKGLRFILANRTNGEINIKTSLEICFAFHHINAFERENKIIIDVATYPNSSIIDELYLEKALSDNRILPKPSFRRFTIDLNSDLITSEKIVEEPIELPKINYSGNNTKPYRFAYGVSFNKEKDFLNQLVKVDIENRKSITWYEKGMYPGEPVFVSSLNATREDEGVILSVILDSHTNKSFLIVLNAEDFKEIGRAFLPHHIPFGFHGNFHRKL